MIKNHTNLYDFKTMFGSMCVHRPEIGEKTFKVGHDFPILSFAAINQGEKQVCFDVPDIPKQVKKFCLKKKSH